MSWSVSDYLDLVFFINFFFDSILLFSVALILKRQTNLKKILLGSLFGTVSIFCLFIRLSSVSLFLIKLKSNEDKNVLANFLLGKDQAGVRYIARALNDPTSLVQMAWYLTNGKKAISTIQDYYKK